MSKPKITQDLPIGIPGYIKPFFDHPAKHKVLTKGRQVGGSLNTIHYLLQRMLNGPPIYALWVDTAYSMLRAYRSKYWLPLLRKLPKRMWHYNLSSNILTCNKSEIIFKSYDNAESLQGNNFNMVILNEAGFLLRDPTFFEESILPMTFVHDAEILINGTPKGGIETYYYKLVDAIETGKRADWFHMNLTTYDNPFIKKAIIDEFVKTNDPITVQTEIYGKFPTSTNDLFFWSFKHDQHIKETGADDSFYLSWDFNLDKMSCYCFNLKHNRIEVFDEFFGHHDIIETCKAVRSKYQTNRIIGITGDASAYNNATNSYHIICKELSLNNSVIKMPSKNPTHADNKILVNLVLQANNFTVDPKCKMLIRDLLSVRIVANKIDKSNNELTHASDAGIRYPINTYLSQFYKTKPFTGQVYR